MKQSILFFCIIFLAGCQTDIKSGSSTRDITGNEEIINGDFAMGKEHWELWHDKSADASFEIVDSRLKLTISDPGKRRWSIMLSNSGVILRKGRRYTISFSAKSDTESRIYTLMGMSREPYYGYSGAFHFYPTTEMREYSYTFVMRQETDTQSSVQFSLGNYGARTIWIDDVRIIDEGPEPISEIPKEFPPPRTSNPSRGIQFGMEMSSPLEGSHVPQLTEKYFEEVERDGRFDHIRLPVWWEHHTEKEPPFTIDPDFLRRVDWAVSQSLSRGYPTILNMHWFRAMEKEPKRNKEEFLAVWRQIAEYFKEYPQHLYLELMNEPNGALDRHWDKFAVEAYDLIRSINPDRPIVISGIYWAHMTHLTRLKLPQRIKQDPNVLIQFHPYVPAEFCFQGSPGNGNENAESVRWLGTDEEKAHITGLFDSIESWARKNSLKLYNGEFTAMASGNSLLEDRLRWISFMVAQCEERGIGWNYWDFGGEESFVYDTATGEWNEDIMGALFPKQ